MTYTDENGRLHVVVDEVDIQSMQDSPAAIPALHGSCG